MDNCKDLECSIDCSNEPVAQMRARVCNGRLMVHFFIISMLWIIVSSAGFVNAQEFNPSQTGSVQNTSLSDNEAWQNTARRAEEAIAAGRASSEAFEELRTQLVTWREKFRKGQSTNQSSINTLQAQITALGPKPDGVEEAPEIAAKRTEMEQRMGLLVAPVQSAEVSYSQADGLIRAIDEIIRRRNTAVLLELGPTPVNPNHWKTGLDAAGSTLHSLVNEFKTSWSSSSQQVRMKQNLPVIVVLLLFAFALLLRGRYWAERLTLSVQAKNRTSARWLMAFLLSFAQLILPLIGIMLLEQAAYATEMIGVRGDIVVSAMVEMAVIFMVARWLAGRVFPKSEHVAPPLNLVTRHRTKGRFFASSLGFLIGLNGLIDAISQFENWSIQALVVLVFPVLLLAGYAMLRLSRLLGQHVENERGDDREYSYRNRIIHYLGRIVFVLAIAGPFLALVGYFQAAQSIVFPAAISLGLLAFLLVLHRLISEVYALLVGSVEKAREALIPVLLSFAMVLAALPVFALIWGVRRADLFEIWARFKTGFSIGDARISPSDFLTFALVFVVGYILTRLVQGTLRSTVLPKTKMDVGGQNAIVSGLGYIGIFLAAVVAISSAGIDLSSLAIVAGALSVGIGFGLQNIVSNFVSGIILLVERPISEGDWIEVGDEMGIVRNISVRSTRIETFDRTDVIVPNSDLVSGVVTNWTRGNSVGRVIVSVGVAYGTDTKRVEGLLRTIAEAHPMVLANPAPLVLFSGFGADSLDFEIRAILRDVNWKLSVNSDMNHEIARVFAEENIEIPFAQRDVWLRNPEVLQRGDE